MRVHIPAPVNRVLDAMDRRHWAVAVSFSFAAVVLLPVATWVSRTGAGYTAAALLGFFVAGTFGARIRQLREQVRQRDYEIAARDARIAELSTGDPTAPTTQLRSIPDGGERL